MRIQNRTGRPWNAPKTRGMTVLGRIGDGPDVLIGGDAMMDLLTVRLRRSKYALWTLGVVPRGLACVGAADRQTSACSARSSASSTSTPR